LECVIIIPLLQQQWIRRS